MELEKSQKGKKNSIQRIPLNFKITVIFMIHYEEGKK
jgi:hypothetical protein